MSIFKFGKKTQDKTVNAVQGDNFAHAKSWADDRFAANERSRARYQAAFLTSMGLNVAAVLAVSMLAGMQTLVPMLVHHYDNGVTTVEPINGKTAPVNRAQVESDIARYVENRESYDISSYRAQFDLVTLLSSTQVAKDYSRLQKASNKAAPINQLGNQYTRRVHIYSINFLDNFMGNDNEPVKARKNHHNLAEVVFSVTDIDKETGKAINQSYNALVSWQYKRPSDSPAIRWQNWDGFEVTRYTRQLRNDKA